MQQLVQSEFAISSFEGLFRSTFFIFSPNFKAFVSQFSLNLRADLVSKGIHVTSVEPGLAETEFSLVRFKGDNEKASKVYENTNFIKPEDIGETIYWVATRPKNININRIEIMAGLQAFNPFNIIKAD